MVIAVTKQDRIPFVHPFDRDLPEDEQTIFYAVPMDMMQLRQFMTKYVSEEGDAERKFPVNELMDDLRKYLGGWKNFKDSKGNEVAFPRDELTGLMDKSGWKFFSARLFPGLIQAMIEANSVTDDEAKN